MSNEETDEELIDYLIQKVKEGEVQVYRDDSNGDVLFGHQGKYFRATDKLINYVREAYDLDLEAM